MDTFSPVVIGGTGGSGTRMVQDVVSGIGFFMGKNLNESNDAMDFEPFLDDTINTVLSITGGVNYVIDDLPSDYVQERVDTLQKIAQQYEVDVPSGSLGWGWKNPRSIYILPLIHAVFPAVRYIHVVRDGRDMAVSGNQNQRNKHYSAMFSEDENDPVLDSIALWCRVNEGASAWGKHYLGNHYYCVRFEDFCFKPQETVTSLCQWLGAEKVDVLSLCNKIQAPTSLGRYRQLAADALSKAEAVAEKGLLHFSYK